MLFNSFEYLIFLPIVYLLYWFATNGKLNRQNLVVFVASYIFYGMWDWRFLTLIALNTVIDFLVTNKMATISEKSKRKPWLACSLTFNLGMLCFFKYYNFFVDSWIDLFAQFGYEMSPWTLNVILPIGISFYTFQTLAYVVDIYRGKIEPCKNLLTFASFISFFPQLLAGPIERATNLLPQLSAPRKYSYVQTVQGLRLILWGLFKKIVIADSLGPVVEEIFSSAPRAQTGTTILMGGFFYSFQMYADFSGYTDIALGSAKMLGIELTTNFRFPMFSRNMLEFWQRWHITLSTWFRDYVYIPLGGSKKGTAIAVRNIFIIFLLSGLWHGANWTFVVWGAFHAFFYLPVFVYRKIYKRPMIGHIHNKLLRYSVHGIQVLFTLFILSVSRLFYRADTIEQSYLMIKKMILMPFTAYRYEEFLWYIIALVVIEFFIRRDERNPISIKNIWLRYSYCSCLLIAIILHLDNDFSAFLYFQF